MWREKGKEDHEKQKKVEGLEIEINWFLFNRVEQKPS